MSENAQNQQKVIHEIVAYRYSDEESIMLVGEADVTIEMLADSSDHTEIYTNLLYTTTFLSALQSSEQ